MALCFKDQTFCSSDCRNDNCFRFWTDEMHEQAQRWWPHDKENIPIAWADLSKDCPKYLP